MGIDTIAPRPSEIANARLLIEVTCADVEIWKRQLGRINADAKALDPTGDRGQRLEDMILRGQAIIGAQVGFLCGMPIERIEGARA